MRDGDLKIDKEMKKISTGTYQLCMYIVNFGNLLQYKLKSKGSRSRMSRSFKKVLENKSTFLF